MSRRVSFSPWRISLLLTASGAYALISQTVLLRQFIATIGGNELAIGLFFVLWFAGIGFGAELGRLVSDCGEKRKGAIALLFVGGAAAPIILLMAMKSAPLWFSATTGDIAGWGVSLLAAALCAPLGFWIGLTFPIIASAAADSEHIVGRMYVAEAIGSMAAGFLFAYVLAVWVPPVGSALLAGSLLVAAAVAVSKNRVAQACLTALAAVLLVTGVSGTADRWEQALEGRRFAAMKTGAVFSESLQTRQQNVTFATAGDQVQIYGNGTYLDSFPDPYVYRQEAAMILAQHAAPRRVVLLGGGVTGTMREVLAATAVERLVLVELDGALVKRIIEKLPDEDRRVLRDPRLQLIHRDERRFLRDTTEHFEIAVVVAPDPSTALIGRLYTVEFFREVSARLSEHGVVILTVTGAENYLGEEIGGYLASLKRSLDAVFPYSLILPGEQTWLIAGHDAVVATPDTQRMKQNYASAFAGEPPLPVEVVEQFVVPERIAMARTALRDRAARVNSDLRPIAFMAYLRIWDRYVGGSLRGLLKKMAETSTGFWLVFWIGVALLIIAAPFLGGGEAAARYALTSLATSGFCAMGAIIVVTLAYQSLIGNAYQMMALLLGLFMAGIAVGGAIATQVVRRRLPVIAAMLIGDLAFAGTVLALAFFLPRAGGVMTPVLLPLLLATTGLCSGVAFPLAAKALARREGSAGRRAGRVDAVDHFAALCGAAVIGLWLLPNSGLVASCWVMVALKGASAIGGALAKGRLDG